MNKYTLLSLILALSFCFSACEDQLDIAQHGVTGVDDYYKTDTDAEEAISDIYYRWQTHILSFFYLTNFTSDDMYAGGNRRGANVPIEALSGFTFDASNTHIENVFTSLYQMVYRANAILDNLEPTTARQKQVASEAHFFRAWCYFYLTALWGTPPLADHVLKSDEYTLPNTPTEELWAFVESDLKGAISSGALAEKASVDDVQVRITKTAAQAMLGKVYVWEKKWSEARDMLDQVINSGKYDLFGGDYGEILCSSTDFNCENILEANFIKDAANTIYHGLYISIGWRGEFFSWVDNDCDVGTNGWGQANPRRDLYDAFVEREGKDGYRLTHTLWDYETVKSHGIYIKSGSSLEQHDGIFSWKLRFSPSDFNNSPYNSHANLRYMRFAEVLLLAAEAHLQSGGSADKALEYVNRIRERAQLEPLSSVTMDDVKIEKRLELCYEGTRFMDLVRWGDAATELADKDLKIGTFKSDGTWIPDAFSAGGGFKSGKHELLPFPTKEMTVNKQLTQNPGW